MPYNDKVGVGTRIVWTGYSVWMLAFICILVSSLLQRSVKIVTDDMKGKKSFIARILGGKPSICQTIFFLFTLLPIPAWPIGFLLSGFLFDAPIHNAFDEIGRFGMIITFLSYPIYFLPLLRFAFYTSSRTGKGWTFYIISLIPTAIFFLFVGMTALS